METVTCMSLEEMEWSISIAEEEEVQECGDVIYLIVMVYSRVSTSTLALLLQVFTVFVTYIIFLNLKAGQLKSAVIYFTLDSEANEDPPEFTLTCQSKGGPATEVVWMRNGVRVEEDSNHTTSQIIVDTSGNTVYNNTLRVRGRETGGYLCRVENNRYLLEVSNAILGRSVMNFGRYFFAYFSCSATSKPLCYIQDTNQYLTKMEIHYTTSLCV